MFYITGTPQAYKLISLSPSQLTPSSSRHPLSPSLTHELPLSLMNSLSLSSALGCKSPIPNPSQGQGDFKMAWSTFSSTCSSPGSLGFQVLRTEEKLVQGTPTCAAPIYVSRMF